MSKLWGVEDLAEFLGVSVQTIYHWRTKNYGPPGRRIGKYVRYSPTDVEEWLERQDKEGV